MAQLKPIQFKAPKQSPSQTYDFPAGYAGGTNYRATPDLVKPNQSPDMLNMNYDDGGVPTKRPGEQRATATSWGATGIKGMYEYWKLGATTPIFLCAHGGKIYSYDPAADTKTSLMTGSKASIADAPTTWLNIGDKAYCWTGADFVVYDGTNPVADVVGKVPTIVTGKKPDGTGGTANEDLNRLSNSWKEEFDGTVGDTAYVLTMAADSVRAWKADGSEIAAAGITFPTGGDYTKITFSVAPGVGTITIQGTKADLNDFDDIRKCTLAHVYGGKNDTAVHISGHPDKVNSIFVCGLTDDGLPDPTYWPAPLYPDYNGYLIGSDAEAVKGMASLIDYQIVGKERSFKYREPGELTDAEGNTTAVYKSSPFNDEFGLLAGRTLKPVQNGLVGFVCDNEGNPAGMGYILPSTVRGQLNIKIISEDINKGQSPLKGLLNYTLAEIKASHAIVHDSKYYLFIGDKTWVLDLEYSDLPNKVACWYPYDTAYAKVGAFLSRYTGELWLGDSTAGLIYKPRSADTATTYQDDSTAYSAYWQAPLLFVGARDIVKEFQFLRLTFAGQPDGNHTLIIITDQENEDVPLIYQDELTMDYDDIDYDDWTYGVAFWPYPQSERIGYRSVYLSWKLTNNRASEKMTILGQSLQYRLLDYAR